MAMRRSMMPSRMFNPLDRQRLRCKAEEDDFEASFAREVARRKSSEESTKSKNTPKDGADMIREATKSASASPRMQVPPSMTSTATQTSFKKKSPKSPPPPRPKFAKSADKYGSEPFARSTSARKAAAEDENPAWEWGQKQAKMLKKMFDFQYLDPDAGKDREGGGNVIERSVELGKLALGFVASFWPLSAAAAAIFGIFYFGLGSSFIHSGPASSKNVPTLSAEAVLRDLE
eukprot:CAMPEP_0167761010 /NCGR_PEP_ID=MMETSP0110_2-20121227/11911_1 /TAXON_ID=629695 /ORGANISM="Gymnochlora sp., Strain CCMP2014" /LENGTH=231 /DNA_ID=CAMNT_0007647599 /DNA_START=98 /DNA_END=796 /DNA_ORIENTATION=+